jgi:hypothetical protein
VLSTDSSQQKTGKGYARNPAGRDKSIRTLKNAEGEYF